MTNEEFDLRNTRGLAMDTLMIILLWLAGIVSAATIFAIKGKK